MVIILMLVAVSIWLWSINKSLWKLVDIAEALHRTSVKRGRWEDDYK